MKVDEMKKLSILFIFLIVVIGDTDFLCYAKERPKLYFDDRNWEIGYQASNHISSLIEYVLKGETVHNWSELVSVGSLFGLQEKITPDEFVKLIESDTTVRLTFT